MRNAKKFLLLLIFIASAFILRAQQNDSITQKLDEYLFSANNFYKFNGSALIAQHGKILLQKSYGYKNFAKHVLNDNNTIYQIGSITKQFTATVILKLQEEGQLSVKDELSKYFPEFKYAGKITLENLLAHTSGIYNYTNDIGAEDSAVVCNPINKKLVTDIIFKHKTAFKPGTQFQYSNSNFYLLGLIIEKVTGKSYEQNVRDIIFTPLQMQHSLFDFKHSPATNIATGYQTINDTCQIEASAWRWDSTVSYAAGAIFSTTGDMYKWAKAIANKEILSAESWEAALTPQLEHYGYGWYVDSLYGHKTIAHGGGLPGFVAYLSYYPGEDITIILLNNHGWFGEGLETINSNLSAILFHKPYELMHKRAFVKLPGDVLKKYIGRYDFDKKHHVYITLQNDTLQMEAPQGGLPKSPLFAQDDANFYLKIIDARIEFVKDTSGNITELISHYNGKNEVCKKVN
jgi:CubicO group peptidase (beta-lactamase class C family)